MAEHIFPCPGCACKLEVLTEWRGKSVICPHCGKKFSLSPQYFTGVPESQFAPVSKDTSGTIPAYMQKSEVQHKRDLKRAKEKFIRGIIRFVTTAILFTGIAAALLFGGRWFFFTNSGFHKIASSGKVDLHTSGHGMYLKATTGLEKKAFTGKVSWKLNSIMWMALEFQNGEADGKQNLYMESGNEDILLSTFAFENGRLRSITGANGKRTTVKYDLFDRPQSLKFTGGAKYVCRYRWFGPLESMTFINADTNEKITGSYDNFSRLLEFSRIEDGKIRRTWQLDYNRENEVSGIKIYNSKGKLIESSDNALGFGVFDIIASTDKLAAKTLFLPQENIFSGE
ncbi:MAG: hypothetical protein E7057_10915 [Lentisphaerae bacterium]|nr:hypothetical protein [Lentisphaerota bacterium]